MTNFQSFYGIVTMIEDFLIDQTAGKDGCYKLISVEDGNGSLVNFVVEPCTYFVNQEIVTAGDMITGFYDADDPVPLIFPPQFRAIVMAKNTNFANVKVAYFNNELVSSDNTLKLNIAPYTQILLRNGQPFTRNPANQNLIVIYGPTTRSIPAQTTPYKIIVLC